MARRTLATIVILGAAAAACGRGEPRPAASTTAPPGTAGAPIAAPAAPTLPADAPTAPPAVATPPAPVAVELATLPRWPGDLVGGAVEVHAADASGDALQAALAPAGLTWIRASADTRVTGAVAARDRAGAHASLIAFAPSVAVPPPPRLRGKGRHVDLDFVDAPTAELLRLLADVEKLDIVLRGPPSTITLRVKRAPAPAVTAELARAVGLVLDRPLPGLLVPRTPDQPPTRLAPAVRGLDAVGGGRRAGPPRAPPTTTLRVRDAAAGHVLALLDAVARPPGPPPLDPRASVVCDAGQPVAVRLRDRPPAAVRELVAQLGGVAVNGPPCGLAPVTADDAGAGLELVATARQGARAVALALRGDRALVIDDADPAWEVGDEHVTFVGDPAGPRAFPLAARSIEDPLDRLTRARLSATVVGGGRAWAVLEGDGMPWLLEAGPLRGHGRPLEVRIGPGTAELYDLRTEEVVASWRLSARPAAP
ncbi:MAG: hypothetical protein KJZ91_25720 [Myxococcales bacterium]|nr:hypothetical protein [Myxococcales bacterium]